MIALYGSYQSILDINNFFHIDFHRAETCKHQLSQVRAWKTKGLGAKMCTPTLSLCFVIINVSTLIIRLSDMYIFSGARLEHKRQGCQDVHCPAKLDVNQSTESWVQGQYVQGSSLSLCMFVCLFVCYMNNVYKVAVGDLQDILKIDKANLLVTVQPGVTIGLLNR